LTFEWRKRRGGKAPAASGVRLRRRKSEIVVADTKTKHTPKDTKFISFEEDDEIDYWTEKFGVCRDHLARAVARVGRSAEAVERYIKATWPYSRVDEG
jgi:hypothetical protein